jgi:hypothetical protein
VCVCVCVRQGSLAENRRTWKANTETELRTTHRDGMDWVSQDGAMVGCSEHVTNLHVTMPVRYLLIS